MKTSSVCFNVADVNNKNIGKVCFTKINDKPELNYEEYFVICIRISHRWMKLQFHSSVKILSQQRNKKSFLFEHEQFADDVVQNDDDDLREKFDRNFRERKPSDENRKNREFRKKREEPSREKRCHLSCEARSCFHAPIEHPCAICEKLKEDADCPANRVVGKNSERCEFVDGDKKKKVQEERESAKKQVQ